MSVLTMLGQAQPSPGFVNEAFWYGVAVLGGGASVAIMMSAFRQKEKRLVGPQPFRVEGEIKAEPKGRRFSSEAYDQRNLQFDKRLDGHDEEITRLWTHITLEDEKIRKELSDSFQGIQRSLGRIEGKLDGE
jgi:hypothetical protein